MGVEKPDLFKQWKMMQDVDRILAEVAKHAAVLGLDLESVREVLLANMLGEQPVPSIFAASRRLNPKPRRCASSQRRLAPFQVTLQLTLTRVTGVRNLPTQETILDRPADSMRNG